MHKVARKPIGSIRTTGGSGVVLDGSSLAVELVVNHPGKLGVSAVEAALESRADGSAAQLLSSAEHRALREHGCWRQSNGCCVFASALADSSGIIRTSGVPA